METVSTLLLKTALDGKDAIPDSPEDVCRCGDARQHHGKSGCVICQNVPNAWSGFRCRQFRLFRRAHEPSPLPQPAAPKKA